MSNKNSVEIEVQRQKIFEKDPASDGEIPGKRGSTLRGTQKRGIVETSSILAPSKRQRTFQESSKSVVTIDLEMEENCDEEDCYPVTVETKSVCLEEEGAILLNHVQVDMLSHCIFCLRKTGKDSGMQEKPETVPGVDKALQTVPRASLTTYSLKLLATFNRVLEYFQNKNKSDQDPLGLLDSSNANEDKTCSMTFLDLPIMCQFCAEKMEGINKLLEELKIQLNVLHEVMQDSKPSGKYSQRIKLFENSLRNSNLEGEMIAATISLLNHLEFRVDKHREEAEKDPLSNDGLMDDLMMTSPGNSSACPQEQFLEDALEEKSLSWYSNPPETATRNELEPLSKNSEERLHEAFDDEDEWSDGGDSGSDSTYIKSEPENDFSDDNSSSNDSIESYESTTPNRKIPERKNRASSLSPSIKKKYKSKLSGLTAEEKVARRRIKYACNKKEKRDYAQSSLREQMEQMKTFSRVVDQRTGKQKFTCEMGACGKPFPLWRTLWEHQVKDHNLNIVANRCDLCGKTFSFLKGLERHKDGRCRKQRRKESKQACDLCKVEVPASKIFDHVREHVGDEYVIRCPYPECTHVYSNYQQLFIHFERKKVLRCHRNGKSIFNEQEFKQKINTCQVCGYKAANALGLKGHLRRMHETPTQNFSCPIQGCAQKFTLKQSVHLHIKQHDLQGAVDKQDCSECSSKIILSEMEGHLKEAHQAKEVIKCNRCPFLFSTRELLVEHLYAHRKDVLACDICGDDVKFARHVLLREHYFRVHQVGKQYVCEQCGYANLSQKRLMSHFQNHHNKKQLDGLDVPNKEIAKVKCDACDADFKEEYALRDHAIKEHGAEPYSCRFCSATLNAFNLLNKHEKEHKVGDHKEEHRCEEEGCGKAFKIRSNLNKHIASAHRGERPHVCELCGKSYAQAQGLRIHKDAFHLGLRPYICDTCGESFTHGSALRRHKLIHTGERPFPCEICGQRFRHREVLKTHVEGHQRKGADFKPNGPMKQVRKRVEKKI